MMGENVPDEVIEKIYEQFVVLSEILKSYFDRVFVNTEHTEEDLTAIKMLDVQKDDRKKEITSSDHVKPND